VIFQYPDPSHTDAGVPQLRVEVDGNRRIMTVRACGEIDLATADLLDAGVAYGLRSRPARLVVQMAQVTFFSAAGLRALMIAHNVAAESEVDLVLDKPSTSVRTVLELSRTCGIFRVEQRPAPAARPGIAQGRSER